MAFGAPKYGVGGKGGPQFLWNLYLFTEGVWFTYPIFETEKKY